MDQTKYAPLEHSLIRNYIPEGIIGNYWLAKRDLIISDKRVFQLTYDLYTGRSNDVQKRLLQHCAKSKYDYFIFEEASNKEESAKKELNEWILRSGQLDNKIRPSKLPGGGGHGN